MSTSKPDLFDKRFKISVDHLIAMVQKRNISAVELERAWKIHEDAREAKLNFMKRMRKK